MHFLTTRSDQLHVYLFRIESHNTNWPQYQLKQHGFHVAVMFFKIREILSFYIND